MNYLATRHSGSTLRTHPSLCQTSDIDKHLGGTIPTFKNVKSSLHVGLGTGKITVADRFPCDFYLYAL